MGTANGNGNGETTTTTAERQRQQQRRNGNDNNNNNGETATAQNLERLGVESWAQAQSQWKQRQSLEQKLTFKKDTSQ